MKKIQKFAILVICSLLLSVSLFGCKKSDTPDSKTPRSSTTDATTTSETSLATVTSAAETSATAPGTASPEDYFAWSGNTIVVLTEKGKSATEIIIPKNAEKIEVGAFSGSSIKILAFEEG